MMDGIEYSVFAVQLLAAVSPTRLILNPSLWPTVSRSTRCAQLVLYQSKYSSQFSFKFQQV